MGGRGSKKTEEEGSDAQTAEQIQEQPQSEAPERTETATSTVAGLEGATSVLEPLPVHTDESGDSSKASLKHNDSHGSHLHMGMKISSTVSFGQLTEEVSKPLSKARSALKSVHSRMDLIQVRGTVC